MIVKRSISIGGHRTSYSIEDEFFHELQHLAKKQNLPLARLVASIDREREQGRNLSSALRLYVLNSLKNG